MIKSKIIAKIVKGLIAKQTKNLAFVLEKLLKELMETELAKANEFFGAIGQAMLS